MEGISVYGKLLSWKENKRGMCPLAIGISYAGKLVGFDYLHQMVRKTEWDFESRVVTNAEPAHELLNQLLENRINKHRNYFLRRQVLGLAISREVIKKYLDCGGTEDFYLYAASVIETKKLSDGKPYSDETKRMYLFEIERMRAFKSALVFKNINVNFLQQYKSHLQNACKTPDGKPLHKNTIWKALKFIRMIYKQAIKDELIPEDGNPFKVFNVGDYQMNEENIKYLEVWEVEAIERTLIERRELLEDMTFKVGWRFLAMCVLGIRISDAMMLNDAFFNDRGDLDFKPFKTRRWENRAQIPIVSERQRRYLRITMTHKFPDTDPKSFRTTFNAHLKILGARADIKINLTSHVGRHTMGSLLVDANVEAKAVKAILGVKSDDTLNAYLHLKQSKLQSEASKLKNIM